MRSAGFLLVTTLAFGAAAQPAPPPPPPPPPAPQPAAQPASQPAAPIDDENARRPWEIFADLGIGNAVCGNDKPDSDCPVDGGGAFALGGAYRFHPHWAVGLELGIWVFKVRDAWQGQLPDKATDVSFSSVYLSPIARWYWLDSGSVDPYLQAGIGLGSVKATASNASGDYEYTASGLAYSLGIGVDWKLSRLFRLGPQALAYLHVSSNLCETSNGNETCRSPGKNADGSREGLALPWRIVAVGTFTLGDP